MVTGHSGKASPIFPNGVADEIQWSGRWGSLRRNDRVCKHRLCWVYHLTLIERHFKAAFALNRPSAATAVTTESSQIPQVVASTERSLEETLQCDYFRRVGFVCVFFLNLLSICVCFLDLHCICFLQLWQVNSFVILWKPLWEIGLWKRRGFVRLCIGVFLFLPFSFLIDGLEKPCYRVLAKSEIRTPSCGTSSARLTMWFFLNVGFLRSCSYCL